MFVREVFDFGAEVPGCVPVGISCADSAFATDGHFDSLIESGEVEYFFGAEAMSDGGDSVGIDSLDGQQQIECDLSVPQHAGHPFAFGVSSMEFFGFLFCLNFVVGGPEEIARAEADRSAFGQFPSESFFGSPFDASWLSNAVIDGRVENEDAGPSAFDLSGPQQISFFELAFFDFVGDQFTDDAIHGFGLEDAVFSSGTAFFGPGVHIVDPALANFAPFGLPLFDGAYSVIATAHKRRQLGGQFATLSRRRLDFGEPIDWFARESSSLSERGNNQQGGEQYFGHENLQRKNRFSLRVPHHVIASWRETRISSINHFTFYRDVSIILDRKEGQPPHSWAGTVSFKSLN